MKLCNKRVLAIKSVISKMKKIKDHKNEGKEIV